MVALVAVGIFAVVISSISTYFSNKDDPNPQT